MRVLSPTTPSGPATSPTRRRAQTWSDLFVGPCALAPRPVWGPRCGGYPLPGHPSLHLAMGRVQRVRGSLVGATRIFILQGEPQAHGDCDCLAVGGL